MERNKQIIGFIWTRCNGQGMAANLLKGGHSLVVYNRTKEKAQSLLDAGAEWVNTVAEVAQKADVLLQLWDIQKM